MIDSIFQFIIDLSESFPLVGIGLTIVIAWAVTMIAGKMVYGAVSRSLRRTKFSSKNERQQRVKTLVAVFTSIITGLIALIGFVIILTQLGVDLTSLATGIGALGLFIGLAGQSMFREVYRGISILFSDQMRVDDIVGVADKMGTVESISLFSTRLRDLDGMLHVIPNGEITVVTNMSRNFANVNFDVRVAYDADIDLAEKIMNKLGCELAEDSEFKTKFLEPIQFYRVNSFDDVGVNLKALGKVEPGMQWSLAAQYRRRLLTLFQENDILIPLPQLYVHSDEVRKSV